MKKFTLILIWSGITNVVISRSNQDSVSATQLEGLFLNWHLQHLELEFASLRNNLGFRKD